MGISVTIFSVCVNLLRRWSEMVLTQCDFPCSALNVNVVRISNKHVCSLVLRCVVLSLCLCLCLSLSPCDVVCVGVLWCCCGVVCCVAVCCGLGESMSVGTRKMTFPWWLVAILPCESFVTFCSVRFFQESGSGIPLSDIAND